MNKLITLTMLMAAMPFLSAINVQAQTPATQAVLGELGPEYLDASFGFAIRPPAGSGAKLEKKVLGPNDVEVVRFVLSPQQWTLSVRIDSDARPPDIEQIKKELTANLETQYKNVQVLDSAYSKVGPYTAGGLAISFTADDATNLLSEGQTEWLQQQTVLQTGPSECYVLVLVTPLQDRQIAESTFDKIVHSFEVRRTEQMEQQIRRAMERGTALLKQINEGEVPLPPDLDNESYMRILRNGREVGFMGLRETNKISAGRKGVQLYHYNWLFNDDGSVSNMEHGMFVSNDLSLETWEYRLRMLSPPTPGTKRTAYIDAESALREKDKLLVLFPGKATDIKMSEKVIEVSDSYAPMALMSILPRVVDLEKPELYAFSTYEMERRGLVLRTVQVVGAKDVVVDGQRIRAYKLIDSEGLLPPFSEIYVDRDGKLLKLSAGKMEMILSSHSYVERKYRARLDESLKLFEKYLGGPKAGQKAK